MQELMEDPTFYFTRYGNGNANKVDLNMDKNPSSIWDGDYKMHDLRDPNPYEGYNSDVPQNNGFATKADMHFHKVICQKKVAEYIELKAM